MKNYQFWFVVGSQCLYGPEVLATVDMRAKEMAETLSKTLPYPLIYKVTTKSADEITEIIKEANYCDECAGLITWCHTFSPSKMCFRNRGAILPLSITVRFRTKRSIWIL